MRDGEKETKTEAEKKLEETEDISRDTRRKITLIMSVNFFKRHEEYLNSEKCKKDCLFNLRKLYQQGKAFRVSSLSVT